VAQADGQWGLQSVHHTLSLLLLPPRREDCSHSAPAPVWVPHGVTSPASKPAPAWALHRVIASFRHPPAPPWAAGGYLLVDLPGLQVNIWSTMDLHGLQGDSLPHHGLLHGCRGISALMSATPPPPPSSLTLVSVELFLCHILTPLLRTELHCCAAGFFPLLKYVIPEALPPSPPGSGLTSSGSVLEMAGIGSIGHGGSFSQLLTEATPVAPQLPKPCYTHPVHLPTQSLLGRFVTP